MLVKLAVHGAGIVVLPAFMAEEAVAQGRVVRLLPQWQPLPLALYLVYGSPRHQAMAVRTLIDHMVESLAAKSESRASLPLVQPCNYKHTDLAEAPVALRTPRLGVPAHLVRSASPLANGLGLVA